MTSASMRSTTLCSSSHSTSAGSRSCAASRNTSILGTRHRTAGWPTGLEEVRDLFADSSCNTSRSFRIFRGEQRALGELLLVPSAGVSIPAPRWECVGYAAFVQSLADESTRRWWRRLRCDIEQAPARDATELRRLQLVHGGLMDIIDVLDPDDLRIPSNVRRRLTGAHLPVVANDGHIAYSGAA